MLRLLAPERLRRCIWRRRNRRHIPCIRQIIKGVVSVLVWQRISRLNGVLIRLRISRLNNVNARCWLCVRLWFQS